jgi:hypothetical protein
MFGNIENIETNEPKYFLNPKHPKSLQNGLKIAYFGKIINTRPDRTH